MTLATNYYKIVLSQMHAEFVAQDEFITQISLKGGISTTPSVAMADKITGSSWKSTKATEYADEIKGMIHEFETMWTNTKGYVWMDWDAEQEQVDDQSNESWKTKSDL